MFCQIYAMADVEQAAAAVVGNVAGSIRTVGQAELLAPMKVALIVVGLILLIVGIFLKKSPQNFVSAIAGGGLLYLAIAKTWT